MFKNLLSKSHSQDSPAAPSLLGSFGFTSTESGCSPAWVQPAPRCQLTSQFLFVSCRKRAAQANPSCTQVSPGHTPKRSPRRTVADKDGRRVSLTYRAGGVFQVDVMEAEWRAAPLLTTPSPCPAWGQWAPSHPCGHVSFYTALH